MARVSVIIPTYNRRVYVQEAIDSILAQTYTDYEIVVVDDGSTDGTGQALIDRYASRIKYVWQVNQGESAARNYGLSTSQGHYIALLDSDDLWLPDKLAKQVAVFERRPDVGAVFCQAWVIDGQGQRIADQPLGAGLTDRDLTLERLVLDNDVSGPSTSLIQRGVFDRIGGFDPAIGYGEDWDLWLRIAARYPMTVITEPLACLRRHRGTQSYYPSPDKNARRLKEHLMVIEKAFAKWPGQPPSGLHETALARRYLQAFLSDVAVDNTSAACDALHAVQSIKPAELHNTDTFGQLIVDYAAIIAEDAGRLNLKRAVSYTQSVLAQVQAIGAQDRHFEHYVSGQVYATLGFMAHQGQHTDLARRYFWQAIQYDRRWLRNRGVTSLLIESIVGKTMMQTIRRIAHRDGESHAGAVT